MSNAAPPSETELSWLAVLGLTDPKLTGWGEVRAAQLDAYHCYGLIRTSLSIMSIWVLFVTYYNSIPHPKLYGWLGVLLVFSIGREYISRKRQKLMLSSITSAALHIETYTSIVWGAIWGGLPLMLVHQGNTDQLLPLWAVFAVMMGGAAFAQSAIPIATSAVIIMMGGGLGAAMFQLHETLTALITVGFTLLLILVVMRTGRDFIEHKYASQDLHEKTAVVSMLLREYEDEGGDWMWATDATRCLTHVSPRFAHLLGVDPDALESKPLLQILAGPTWEAGNFSASLRELSGKLRNREAFSDLIVPVIVNDQEFWWELSASPRFDERGVFQGFRGVGSDVSHQQRTAAKINRMASFDTLTGLPNRLQVNESLAQAMNEAKRWNGRCGFIMLDLDRFKAVNDTVGHPIGDKLLTEVAGRLSSIMTANELCGRLGGDEFAIVVKDLRDPAYLTRLG
ncbi:MAG: diguanylate cyclase, partial [Alphaproteobacteria bacterium]|nr:diguanylate cyclase [Alphaproteobacteria bacterium]